MGVETTGVGSHGVFGTRVSRARFDVISTAKEQH